MVEKASSADELLLAVKVLFEVIRLSWRNSEDMERCHGYEILAFLLKAKKREFINGELLQVVAEFIGVDSTDPRLSFRVTLLISRESSVTNPLAFRYLCLDFAIWKRGNAETQISHLQMLLSLIEQSRHRLFNLRRLNKMRTFFTSLADFRCGQKDAVCITIRNVFSRHYPHVYCNFPSCRQSKLLNRGCPFVGNLCH